MTGPETIYQPPLDELPDWVKTEEDIMIWLTQNGMEPGEHYRTEGPLLDGSRIWIRVDE